jgi:hypothetical protein
MSRFKCSTCDSGFYSGASLANLNDKTCSVCGSPVETADEPTERQVLDDRLGHLIARREVARAQARVDTERWIDEGGHVPAPV